MLSTKIIIQRDDNIDVFIQPKDYTKWKEECYRLAEDNIYIIIQ
jgi:hypothetical protein